MINLLKIILKKEGFDVVGAMGGRDGLEAIEKRNPDLVLLDLMIPDIDGWEVYQAMKASERLKNIPVIIMTAKAQSIDKVLGLHDDYITKPFSPDELISITRGVLGRGGVALAPDPIVPPRPPRILTAGAKPEYDDNDLL